MLRRRLRPYSPANDLPPIRRLRWSAATGVAFLGLVGWVRFTPEALVGAAGDDPPLATLRALLIFSVPVLLGVALLYAFWRLRLEWLAYRPGPVLVVPFVTPERHATTDRGDQDIPLGVELGSIFQLGGCAVRRSSRRRRPTSDPAAAAC